jgi:hypothetical protein
MNQYHIAQFENDFPGWENIESFQIENYPWYEKGLKQDTQMQLAIAQGALWWRAVASDIHSFAQVTELNGPVYADSCVEFFLSPRNQLGSAYLNFEVNCCGTLHLAYGDGRENRRLCTLEEAAQIEVRTSIASPVKLEKPIDSEWQIEVRIPLALIESMIKEDLNFDTWHANFYRCGGRVEDQYATWNPVSTAQPDYHRPEHFGKLTFHPISV